MALGDRRYRTRVSKESQAFAAEHGLGIPNVWVPGECHPPYYPESLRAFLADEPEPDELDKLEEQV